LPYKRDESIRLGNIVCKEINCAQPPTKTVNGVQQSKAIRTSIEKFWKELRRVVARYLGVGQIFSDEEISSLLQVISANLDPAYIEAVQLQDNRILDALQSIPQQGVKPQEE